MDQQIVNIPAKESFWQEAKRRWSADTPPFFTKAIAIGGAIAGFGLTLAGVTIPLKVASWIPITGGILFGLGTGISAIAKFVMQVAVILQPGDTLTNKTDTTLVAEVKPGDTPS